MRDHDLLEFRRLSATLYCKNQRWNDSISLSKQDKLFKDAIRTAAQSGQAEVAEELLTYFTDIGAKECFTATLYSCYHLIRPDVVSELTWVHALQDYVMPYRIQAEREQRIQRDTLERELAALKKQLAEQQAKGETDPASGIIPGGGLGGTLMITQGPGPGMVGMPMQGQMTGMPMQSQMTGMPMQMMGMPGRMY